MRIRQNQLLAFLLGMAVLVGLIFAANFRSSNPATTQASTALTVSAAASLIDTLQEIAPLYHPANSTVTVRYNFASSGALQQQIENGSPVDLFISAAETQMNLLQRKNLLVPGSRRNLLKNRMVLIVPANAAGITTLPMLKQNQIQRIAIGDPRSVPAGQYAKQILEKQGLWEPLQSKYVLANNVRQVLQFVESGNAQAGLVYLTDAKTSDQVKIVETIDAKLHDPIVYPIAVIKASKHPTIAQQFSEFLSSDAARAIFSKYGFEMA